MGPDSTFQNSCWEAVSGYQPLPRLVTPTQALPSFPPSLLLVCLGLAPEMLFLCLIYPPARSLEPPTMLLLETEFGRR